MLDAVPKIELMTMFGSRSGETLNGPIDISIFRADCVKSAQGNWISWQNEGRLCRVRDNEGSANA